MIFVKTARQTLFSGTTIIQWGFAVGERDWAQFQIKKMGISSQGRKWEGGLVD